MGNMRSEEEREAMPLPDVLMWSALPRDIVPNRVNNSYARSIYSMMIYIYILM
jgi:hypothetical protein